MDSNKSAIGVHDNGAKLPLFDTKHPSTIDLLPEHEPTDINDKHVENRHTVIMHEHMPNTYIPKDSTPIYDRPVYLHSLSNKPSKRIEPSILKKSVSNNNNDKQIFVEHGITYVLGDYNPPQYDYVQPKVRYQGKRVSVYSPTYPNYGNNKELSGTKNI
ncbi:uncharacterized protein LOC120358952 [Solenopsis invicta]|uniref:uncharacterized protein LOC120358952 n=1 Tax=Solenopsis invicta TaxID=13686 RepID=UPI00193E8296|nr:uncharacterized protein LOC120358952 [Solenopsis invicta]